LDNKVYDIIIEQPRGQGEQEVPSPVTHTIKSIKKKWESCKNSRKHSSFASPMQSYGDSDIEPDHVLTITNLSLNFQRNIYGLKNVELHSNESFYTTEQLKGNNLIWIGKQFQFEMREPSSELLVVVKGEDKKIFGQLKISFKDLLLSRKQGYFQGLVLGEKEIVGNLVIGYELPKSHQATRVHPHQGSASHSATELKKKPVARPPRTDSNYPSRKLPSPKANPIKQRKYTAGKNIKIGRAHRFDA
jgi:hypothetical protein